MKTSIVILTYNKLEYTKECIESIREHTDVEYEIIIVDNNSTDETVEWIREQKDLKYILNDNNLGFPEGCNQGIRISEGDNILLLNNDVVVTENWLSNLIKVLYSDEKIGAVGPVTNSSAYYQSIDVDYKSLEEMQLFAKGFNKSDETKWEERLKLIGFCMLIKRQVIDEIGYLDNIFTPGNYEDDDYSVRIRNLGYKLILCNDTFIHHYGGTSFKENKEFLKLLKINEEKFKAKWGFASAENMRINRSLVSLINEPKEKAFNVLEIGCGCGATLLYIKNKYKNSKLYGADSNNLALNQADFLDGKLNERINNIYNISSFFKEIKFDYIIINDILEKEDIYTAFIEMKNLLASNGKIFIELMEGRRENELTSEYIIKNLTSSKFKNIEGIKINVDGMVKSYIFIGESVTEDFVKEGIMDNIIINIEKNIDFDQNINKLLQALNNGSVNTEEIITNINANSKDKCFILNILGGKAFEKEMYDFVLPFLNEALAVNAKDKDTLINMGIVLEAFGEYELAVNYLEKIENKDSEVTSLIEDIKFKYITPMEKILRKLKFLLRRIENNIEFEESREEVYTLIKEQKIVGDDILSVVEKDIIKKDEILNNIAVKFYEKGLFEEIIPLFQKSYEYNNENFDTIYNLGYFLYEIGEVDMALNYLEKIRENNLEVDNFIKSIKGDI